MALSQISKDDVILFQTKWRIQSGCKQPVFPSTAIQMQQSSFDYFASAIVHILIILNVVDIIGSNRFASGVCDTHV